MRQRTTEEIMGRLKMKKAHEWGIVMNRVLKELPEERRIKKL